MKTAIIAGLGVSGCLYCGGAGEECKPYCFSGCRPHLRYPVIFYENPIMNENQNLLADNDDFDDLDGLFAQFDGVALEGGVNAADEEDNCAGGACKI